MEPEAPKRWDRKRRADRDRRLRWKAFWAFVLLCVIVFVLQALEYLRFF